MIQTIATVITTALVTSVITLVSFVTYFDTNEPGCWNEINSTQPLGIEKICNHP